MYTNYPKSPFHCFYFRQLSLPQSRRWASGLKLSVCRASLHAFSLSCTTLRSDEDVWLELISCHASFLKPVCRARRVVSLPLMHFIFVASEALSSGRLDRRIPCFDTIKYGIKVHLPVEYKKTRVSMTRRDNKCVHVLQTLIRHSPCTRFPIVPTLCSLLSWSANSKNLTSYFKSTLNYYILSF